MLKSTEVETSWHGTNKEWFISKGYKFTKIRDKFLVRIFDLQSNSNVKVNVSCDYCGFVFDIEYWHYIKTLNGVVPNICCLQCKPLKTQESNMIIYGVKNPLQVKEIKQKVDDTFIERYGFKNPLQNKQIKEKSAQTNIEKYGFSTYTQTDEYKERYKNTCQKKYGVDNVFQLERIKEQIKQQNFKKYGVENNS